MKFKSALIAAAVLAMATTAAFAQNQAPNEKGTTGPNTGTNLSNPPKYQEPATNDTRQKNISPASEDSGVKQDK
jgi:hypothetical protein